mgnify:CR=1 FL=1
MCFEDEVTNIKYETAMKIIGRGRELYGYDIWDDVRRLSDYWPYRISKSVVEYLGGMVETNRTYDNTHHDCQTETCTCNRTDSFTDNLLEQIREVITGNSNIQIEISGVKNYGELKQNFRVKFSDGIMKEGVIW